MRLSRHATQRARSRGLSKDDLGLVLRYGRSCYVRGAEILFVGRRETRTHTAVARLSKVEGVHVVCTNDDGAVITVYRNHRAPRAGRARFRPACRLTNPREEARS